MRECLHCSKQYHADEALRDHVYRKHPPKKEEPVGYTTTVSGELNVEPALTDAELGLDAGPDPWRELMLARTEGLEDTLGFDAVGKVRVIKGARHNVVVPRSEEPISDTEEVVKAIQALVRLAAKHRSKVNGAFYCHGEETADIWRIRVKDNKVLSERPTLVWPNGEEEKL